MAERDHRGVDTGGDGLAVGGALADGQQFDRAAHPAGGGDVGGGDLGDALAVHVTDLDPGVEGDPGEDRGLRGGVEALDVGGRVGLGVPEGGGLVERLGVAGAAGVHLVEDEVGRAVHDAENPVDLVARERLAQRPHQRDGPGDGGLVIQVAAVLLGGGVQGRAVLGEQCLVGGDDARAVLEGGGDERAGRLDAPDDLDHDVDVAALHERGRVGGDQCGVDALTHLRGAADGDADELHGRTDARREVVGVRRHDARHL
ncbi:hypothetical protein SMICM304S_03128 [Streptomyces microflavus]